MAINLTSKPNTVPINSSFPYGAIQDDTGTNNGTPVNTIVYGDFHQFFAALMASAGFIYNDIFDGGTINGGLQQYYTALTQVIKNFVVTFVASQAQVNAGTNNTNYVTPLTLKSILGWTNATQVTGWNSVGFTTLGYTKNSIGEVVMRGQSATSMALTFPTIITTLPTGFRPAADVNKVAYIDDGTPSSYVGRLNISASNGQVSLDIKSGYTSGNSIIVTGFDTQFPVL